MVQFHPPFSHTQLLQPLRLVSPARQNPGFGSLPPLAFETPPEAPLRPPLPVLERPPEPEHRRLTEQDQAPYSHTQTPQPPSYGISSRSTQIRSAVPQPVEKKAAYVSKASRESDPQGIVVILV